MDQPPWPGGGGDDRGLRDMLRWWLQRWRHGVAPTPPAAAFPRADPTPAVPRLDADEVRVTWVGHSTFLIQLPGCNVLTDPVWSRRASPVQWTGPVRLAPPGLEFDALPPIDVVLLSHDHYDHLDRPTITRLHERGGDELTFVTPLGYRSWLARLGIERVAELGWHQQARFASGLNVTALPARHWAQRTPWDSMRRLWASFALRLGAWRLYFCGDSGYAPIFADIGRYAGPFDIVLLPIGAYEPRWFMQPAHMNPEEAVQAWVDLGATGVFVAMHWGTFRMTDEPPLEPPERLRAAWRERGLDETALHVPRHGETLRLTRGARP
ncbi:MAG TPA: MBL fold metallo-hydrolase [Longimicrobiales bacterium]|nr:MBL fold metallo-hydrolase [Longimicrobiales bacterium]